jgi:hypothetical protein
LCGILNIVHYYMDPNQITTTFIPKKPLQQTAEEIGSTRVNRAPIGAVLVISIIIGILSAAAVVGVYLYKRYTIQAVENIQKELASNEKELEPNLLVELGKLDKRLKNGEVVLSKHIALSPVFDIIEQNTLKTVRFSSFKFNTENNTYSVMLSGEANSYQAVALQSESFGSIISFREVIFSDFTLTPKNRISFTVSFKVSPEVLNFSTAPIKVIKTDLVQPPVPEPLNPTDNTSQPIDQTPVREEELQSENIPPLPPQISPQTKSSGTGKTSLPTTR